MTKFCAVTRYDKLAQGVHYITREQKNNTLLPQSPILKLRCSCHFVLQNLGALSTGNSLRTDAWHYLGKNKTMVCLSRAPKVNVSKNHVPYMCL